LVISKLLSDCKEERVLTVRIMEESADLRNLEKTCRTVKLNRGSGGVDEMSVDDLPQWLSKNWRNLQRLLLSGYYQPSPVTCVEIPKANGGVRTPGIPTVVDRLVQQAIHQVLSPRYERVFSSSSFGFRPGRGAHDALGKCSEFVASGAKWLVDRDLEKFFDEVNHSRTMTLLGRRIGDKGVLMLIHRYLRSGMTAGGVESQRVKGTHQGCLLFPLISNII
jgi:RNA-directed DNA polymerase